MPENVGQSVYTPEASYSIIVKIKDREYTNDLTGVIIASSIGSAYQIITINMELDPNDVILEDVMGNEPISLEIKLKGRRESYIQSETIKMELQYIYSNSLAGANIQSTKGKVKTKTPIDLITVCRKPYKTMTTIVNKIYENKTPKQIIQDLISATDTQLQYDSDKENTEQIDQLFLPPMTLYKAIRTLDDNYGLFNGASNLGFCQYDNSLYIQNLTSKMNKDQTFTIYHLGGGDSQNRDTVDKCTDGKNFYTRQPLYTKYKGSISIGSMSPNITYFAKPSDQLFKKLDFKTDTSFFQEVGLISKNSENKLDKNIYDTRKRYSYNNTGYEDKDTFAKARLARKLADLAEVKIELERSLKITELMKVGEATKLKSDTIEYKKLEGKYILKTSILTFQRVSEDWRSFATITLMRTNQYSS